MGYERGSEDKQRLYDILKSNYSIVCNIFKHFAGVGTIGERFGISLTDFAHILHLTKLYNFRTQRKKVEECYFKIIAKETPSFWPLMSRTDFLESIVLFAHSHFNYREGKESKDNRGENNNANAVAEFLCGPLFDVWKSLSSNYMIYNKGSEMREVLLKYYSQIKQIFQNAFTKSNNKVIFLSLLLIIKYKI